MNIHITIADFVKFLVELAELCSLSHDIFIHHEWWLDLLVTTLSKKIECIGDQGLVKVHTIVDEKVASVSSYLCTCRPSL